MYRRSESRQQGEYEWQQLLPLQAAASGFSRNQKHFRKETWWTASQRGSRGQTEPTHYSPFTPQQSLTSFSQQNCIETDSLSSHLGLRRCGHVFWSDVVLEHRSVCGTLRTPCGLGNLATGREQTVILIENSQFSLTGSSGYWNDFGSMIQQLLSMLPSVSSPRRCSTFHEVSWVWTQSQAAEAAYVQLRSLIRLQSDHASLPLHLHSTATHRASHHYCCCTSYGSGEDRTQSGALLDAFRHHGNRQRQVWIGVKSVCCF